MTDIEIHEKAAISFNEKANNLLLKADNSRTAGIQSPIQPDTISDQSNALQENARRTTGPDFYVSHLFTESDIIGDIRRSNIDGEGNIVAFAFNHNEYEYSIAGDDYKDLKKVAEQISKIKTINDKISIGFIEETICDWIKNKIVSNEDILFSDYFLTKANGAVIENLVGVPITYLCVQSPFRFGKVIFRPITKADIDQWEHNLIQNQPDHESTIRQYIKDKIRPMQGYSAATMSVKAEPGRADEVILFEAGRSLSLLRIFSVSAIHPKAVSPCVLWGQGHIDVTNILKFHDGQFYGMSQSVTGPLLKPVMLSNEIIRENHKLGIEILDELLNAEKLNSYQQDLLEALFLYSRCTIAKDITDKLMYIISALESIFIRNNTEPIQQNLAERLAFGLVRTADKRRKIIKNVKEVYKLRSSFIHHGVYIEEQDTVLEFMTNAWHAMLGLIKIARECTSKDELLNELEERKLS